jgi:hydrogenase maturation factor
MSYANRLPALTAAPLFFTAAMLPAVAMAQAAATAPMAAAATATPRDAAVAVTCDVDTSGVASNCVTSNVSVTCDVHASGMASNCATSNVVVGADFARSALEHIRRARYTPATHNGVAIATRHTWIVKFHMND